MTETKPADDEPNTTEDNTESGRITERVPGMRPGNTVRNVIVVFGYVMLTAVVLSAISGAMGGGVDDATTETTPTPTVEEATPTPAEADDTETETETETETPTATPEADDADGVDDVPEDIEEVDDGDSLTQEEWLLVMQVTLLDGGIGVDSLEQPGSTVELSYQTTATTEQAHAQEIGYIAGAYAYGVDQGWESDRLEATAMVGNQLIGTWHIEAEWAQAHTDGEMSDEEYFTRILNTLEVND